MHTVKYSLTVPKQIHLLRSTVQYYIIHFLASFRLLTTKLKKKNIIQSSLQISNTFIKKKMYLYYVQLVVIMKINFCFFYFS